MQKICTILALLLSISRLNAQWQPVYGQTGGTIFQLAQTPDQRIWAGTDAGLYVSTDQGSTWALSPLLPSSATVPVIEQSGQEIYIAAAGRLYYSADGSAHWADYPAPGGAAITGLSLTSTAIYAVAGGKLWRSNDHGQNWTLRSGTDAVEIAGAENTLVAFLLSNSQILRISSNNGSTWSSSPLPAFTGTVEFVEVYNSLIYVATDAGKLFVSANFGTNWIQRDLPKGALTPMGLQYEAGELLLNQGGFAYTSTSNGSTWTAVTDGLYSLTIYDIIRVGSRILAGGEDGFWSKDSPASYYWTNTSYGLPPRFCTQINSADGELFAFFSAGRLFRSADDGLSWTEVKLPTQSVFEINSSQAIQKSGPGIYLSNNSSYDAMTYSTDDGASWKNGGKDGGGLFEISLQNNLLTLERDDAVQVFGVPYFNNQNPLLNLPAHVPPAGYQHDYLLLSLSPAKCLSLVSTGLVYQWNAATSQWEYLSAIPPRQGVSSNAFQFFRYGTRIFATAYKTLYYSNDNGSSWQACSLPANTNVTPFDLVQTPYGLFFMGLNAIYQSTDGGISWVVFDQSLPGSGANGSLSYQTGFLYGSFGPSGAWKYELNQTISATGTVYHDLNQNGVREPNETGVQGVVLQSSQGKYTSTDASGLFRFYNLNAGETIKVIPPQPNQVPAPSQYTYLPSTMNGYDFGLYSVPGFDLVTVLTELTPFRPGFDTKLVLQCKNIGNLTANGLKLQLQLPPALSFLSSQPTVTDINGNTLSWQLSDLAPDDVATVVILVNTDVLTALGTAVKLTATATAPGIELTPADNSYLMIRNVVGSYDPNDKLADPAFVTPAMLAAGQPVEYTIRFQNTGNYPADFVRIRDEIGSKFDLSTFRLRASSHPCSWSFKGPRTIEFLFENIQLPDSETQEEASHGFVKFTIRPVGGLDVGDALENTADIYFDYNPAVRTNTAGTQVVYFLPGQMSDLPGLSVRPNPASYRASLAWDDALPVSGTLRLFTAGGIPVREMNLAQGSFGIDLYVNDLPNGSYVAVVEAGPQRYVKTFLIQHDNRALLRDRF